MICSTMLNSSLKNGFWLRFRLQGDNAMLYVPTIAEMESWGVAAQGSPYNKDINYFTVLLPRFGGGFCPATLAESSVKVLAGE